MSSVNSSSPGNAEVCPPDVVLLCNDLMLTSTVSGLVSTAGKRFRSVSSSAQAIALLKDVVPPPKLFVDFATPGLSLSALASELSAEALQRSVVYGPHVHESMLQQARELGFGCVLSRGQFSARLSTLI
jgi:hypothetical protein